MIQIIKKDNILNDGTITTTNVNKLVCIDSNSKIKAAPIQPLSGISLDVSLKLILNPNKWYSVTGPASYTSGTSASTNYNSFGLITYAPTTAGYAIRQFETNSLGCPQSKGKTFGVLNYDEVVAFSAIISPYVMGDAGSGWQMVFGRLTADYTSKTLLRKGFGVRHDPGNALKIVTYASSEQETSTSFTPSVNANYTLVVISKAGTVYCFVNDVLVGTATNGPTGDSAQYACGLSLGGYTSGTVTNRYIVGCSSINYYTE